MSRSDEFLNSHKFGQRLKCFEYLMTALCSLQRPVIIVETGSMRPSDVPEADGQSTLVWDFIVSVVGGACVTVDIDRKHSEYTASMVGKNTKAVTCDSIQFLRGLVVPEKIDLVYLDSMDWIGTQKDDSALHHAGELTAIWKQIAFGGLVAVDDCYGKYEGKHALIECFFNLLKLGPVMEGPIYAWRKP